MSNINVVLWSCEDNYEDCGEIGCSAVVTVNGDSHSHPERLLGPLETWAQREVLAPQAQVVCEMDGDTFRIHVGPHEEDVQFMDEPGDWETESGRYLTMLRRRLQHWAHSRGYSVSFENA